MKKLKEVLLEAEAKKIGIGHFNVCDMAGLRGVFAAAREANQPVVIGVSEGERNFFGVAEIAAVIKAMREKSDFPIYLNADHTHSLDKVEEAARAGFDAILFDGSALPFEENIAETRKAVEMARAINPDIFMEGEIGYIGSSSEILKSAPQGAALSPENFTTPEEAKRFVKETGVDALSPAVGNMHGLLESMVEGKTEKHLDIELIAQIKQATGAILVLHGGSGTAANDFKEAIKAGVNLIHLNSELRLAWRRGIEKMLTLSPDEIAPYKILPGAVAGVKEVVKNRIDLFSEGS